MPGEQKKIIVVDDNIENLTALKNTMKDTYEVYPCPSALKMFNLLEFFHPDIILLDVEMPEMNGYEAIKKLKSNEKFQEIPVIFLTAMGDAQSEIEGLKLGAVDYIHKPFVAPLLLQRIKTHLALMEQKMEIKSLLELKTKEISLREAAELEAENASKAKGDFLSHMSHEIRSPLNA
ncbi:response regulator, partial [Treponema sp. R80B11-R83G3]